MTATASYDVETARLDGMGPRGLSGAPVEKTAAPGGPRSPLTGGRAEKIRVIPAALIVEAYRAEHGFDVRNFLPAIDAIEMWRCHDTGLEFFSPSALEGSPGFYEALYGDADKWAYKDDKWEFDTALRLIGGAGPVLDIGCGGGAFLAKLHGDRVGLETSPFGRRAAKERGLDIRDETITRHVEHNRGCYRAVTAFQVLEHVADPAAFLQAAIDAAAPGGLIVISVPNNDSFLKHCETLALNLPPHHLTRWSRPSLEAIARIFPVDLVWLEKEPLQEDILDWYQSAAESRHLPKSRLLRRLYYRLGGRRFFRNYLLENRLSIDGHTILAAYRKR